MSDIDLAIARLRAAAAGLAACRTAIEAGRPWPAHRVDDDTGPESTWGPVEVLAHVSEMLPFWLGEIERVVDGSPEPVPFGRTASDRLRILTIERDRALPPRELLDRVGAAVDRYARRLPELGPAGLGRRGLHPTRGEMTIGEILERFAVGHAEEHVRQLTAALADAGPGRSAARS